MKKLLFVEDNLMYRTLIKHWLSKTDYNFHIVKSGEEALDKLNNERFDIVFTDLFMIDMSGLMLTEIVKEQFKIPIIIITANPGFEIQYYNFENKFTKPNERKTFLKFLEEHIKND